SLYHILILSNAPTPSNDALFATLARLPGVLLKVIYCALRESHRLWALQQSKGYDFDVASGYTVGSTHFNPGIGRHITGFNPDVVVLTGSYAMPTFVLAVRTLRTHAIPWVYWGEELSFARKSFLPAIVRGRLRAILKQAASIFAIGSRAVESYARLGISRDRIVDFRYYADVDSFRLTESRAQNARSTLRERWGISPAAPLFLFCGQLIPRKGVDVLLDAAALVMTQTPSVHVVLVGAGEQELELRRQAQSLGIAASVHFTGFVQPGELPEYFAAADALVLPSHQEGWGLVVAEALAAGLPVLASERVNSAVDLVTDGECGYRFRAGDAAHLAEAMRALIATLARPDVMRDNARATGERESPQRAAQRMVTLLADAAAPGGARNG
ncbi:MAG: glycosyl transferase group 1, partial [Gemmatimonadetes bacterium]|nr:glycosyl transferase group 1 [Gemmatimonadota bacterium]